jgi:hypothetical protein
LHGSVSANGLYSNPDGEGRVLFVSNNSIEEYNAFQYKTSIYPNPVKNKISISSPESIIKNIFIYNLTGQLIKSYSSDNKLITKNIRGIKDGIYLVNVITDKGISVRKITKL